MKTNGSRQGMLKKPLPRLASGSIAGEKAAFVFWQTVITGINAALGFLIVRSLDKPEYAVYTLGFSLLSLFVNITNTGITPAMSGIGGRVWNDRRGLRALLNTALRLRSQLGWWFAGPFVLYSAWQFMETGLSWTGLPVLLGLLLFAAWVQLQTALYAIVLQLNKAVRQLQRAELRFALIKFAGTAGLLLVFPSAVLAIAWICVCLWLNLQANRRLAHVYLADHPELDAGFQREIDAIIRSNFLRTAYWSLEGQISILLCAVFATTDNLAEIGALGRLGVFFSIFQSFILSYSLPGLSKARETSEIQRRIRRILLLAAGIILPVLAWTLVHPESLIWILGSGYAALKDDLFGYLLAIALGQLAAVAYQICGARAWIHLNRFYVPLALPLQVALLYILDLSVLKNVILFAGINNAFFLLFNSFMLVYSLKKTHRSPDSNAPATLDF